MSTPFTVYLCGPMTGQPNWGFDLFDRAAEWLRSIDWEVISPADMDREHGFDGTGAFPEGWTLEECLRRDFQALTACDAIILLPGWEDSAGGRKGLRVALDIGLKLFVLRDAPLWSLADLRPLSADDAEAILNRNQASALVTDRPQGQISGEVRTFESGATRDTDEGKLDYEGFLSPRVLRRFAEYMHKNRVQSDGSLRASDNWQKGIPRDAYVKSMWRHFMSVWTGHREGGDITDDLCALLFNVMGYLHESLK